ncbi:MAG: phosphonate C-P lyase system protein PhnL [Rhodospirillales bacterium]
MADEKRQNVMISIDGLEKTFTLHLRGGMKLPIFSRLSLDIRGGECLILTGPSGIGKSSLLRCIYGNYLPQAGTVKIRHKDKMTDLTEAAPWRILATRRITMGYVSQFLRAMPRVPTLDIVMDPLLTLGEDATAAREKASLLLSRLRIPEQLWTVPPATFSGGEQQRVNIARSFIVGYPILLLDEPTAALDAENRQTVIELINGARESGAAIVGIFHDEEVRKAVGTAELDLSRYKAAA